MPISEPARIAVVTGAGGGIGRAVSRSLEDAGYRVVGVDLAWPDAAADCFDRRFRCDVTDEQSVGSFVCELTGLVDGVDCLVNAAGITRVAATTELPVSAWQSVLDVTLKGTFLMSRGLYPLLTNRRGAIANISSISGQRVLPGRLAYSTAKSGLDAMTRSLAVEWAASGVRVNAVAPAWVDNEFLRRLEQEGALDRSHLASQIPLGRLCSETDVAEAVLFLIDHSRASFITGQILYVDGGYLHSGA